MQIFIYSWKNDYVKIIEVLGQKSLCSSLKCYHIAEHVHVMY